LRGGAIVPAQIALDGALSINAQPIVITVQNERRLRYVKRRTAGNPGRDGELFQPHFVLPVKGEIMTTSILVTGGTGTLGRPVAQRLRDVGASVTVLSRHPRETAEGVRYTAGDLSTGEGIEAAVRGAEVIVHCAGSRKGDEQKTRTLVSAAKDARHIVLISVVGADRIPQASVIDRAFFGYYGMKLATERVVGQSGIGWTTLRATQVHDLILIVARALAKLPVIPAPAGSRFQPVGRVAMLHRAAAVWCEEHELASDAVGHALAAGDNAGAARLIEQHFDATL